jgi:hypothetical protein
LRTRLKITAGFSENLRNKISLLKAGERTIIRFCLVIFMYVRCNTVYCPDQKNAQQILLWLTVKHL